MTQVSFDATQVDPRGDMSPLPAGEYIAAITESEMKPTKKGDGQYLQLTLQVLDGPHKGRLCWDRLNLVNPNQQAVDIAQSTLSAICHAVGVLKITDSQQLHDKPMIIKVTVRPASGEFEASNDVKAYKPIHGGSAVSNASQPASNAHASAPATEPVQPQAGGSTPPWGMPQNG